LGYGVFFVSRAARISAGLGLLPAISCDLGFGEFFMPAAVVDIGLAAQNFCGRRPFARMPAGLVMADFGIACFLAVSLNHALGQQFFAVAAFNYFAGAKRGFAEWAMPAESTFDCEAIAGFPGYCVREDDGFVLIVIHIAGVTVAHLLDFVLACVHLYLPLCLTTTP
jgi:hypothetical protein